MTERPPALMELIEICKDQKRIIAIRPYKFGRKVRTVGVSKDDGTYEYREGVDVEEAAKKLITHLTTESKT